MNPDAEPYYPKFQRASALYARTLRDRAEAERVAQIIEASKPEEERLATAARSLYETLVREESADPAATRAPSPDPRDPSEIDETGSTQESLERCDAFHRLSPWTGSWPSHTHGGVPPDSREMPEEAVREIVRAHWLLQHSKSAETADSAQ